MKDGRKIFAQRRLENCSQEVVSIDEAGFNLWLSRSRGRAPKGQRAVRVVGGRTGQNFTLIIVVSNQRGLLKHDIVFDHSVGNI